MSSILEKSLDDIIQGKKKTRRSSSGGGVGTTTTTTATTTASPKPAGVRKKRRSRGNKTTTSSSAEGQWKHDKFENLPSKAAASPAGNRGDHTKLIVSNLRDTISSDSLRTLFGQTGKMISVILKVDQSGRSLGSAEIIMASADAAKDAVNAFNNVKVDDQPIRVTLLRSWSQQQGAATTEAPAHSTGAAAAARTVTRTRSGSSANGRGDQQKNSGSKGAVADAKPARRGGRRSRGGGRGGDRASPATKQQPAREGKKAKTAEELDRELDEFLAR